MRSLEIITEANCIDQGKWDVFVYNHVSGNIFQTPFMYRVYTISKKFEPVALAVIDGNKDIQGILLAVVLKYYEGPVGNFTARSIIHGGPLVKNNDPIVLNLLLGQYVQIIKKRAIYSQFRNFWDWGSSKQKFFDNGFTYQDHLNILVDLTKSEEQLWDEMNPKGRNKVRRSVKKGSYFKIEQTEDALGQCYDILRQVYNRAKLPLPDYNYFLNLFKVNTKSHLKIFCAYYDNEIVGCMLGLAFKDSVYDYYAGSRAEYYDKNPNDLIPWEVFKWSKENRYKIFNFGGAGKPNVHYGVRDYKKKFGGRFVNYGRFEKVHQPIMHNFAKFGFKMWQLTKK